MSTESKRVAKYRKCLVDITNSLYKTSVSNGEACANTLLYAESLLQFDQNTMAMFTSNLIEPLCTVLRETLFVKNNLTKNVVDSCPENLINLAPFIEMNNEIYSRAECNRKTWRRWHSKKAREANVKTECEVIDDTDEDKDQMTITCHEGGNSSLKQTSTDPNANLFIAANKAVKSVAEPDQSTSKCVHKRQKSVKLKAETECSGMVSEKKSDNSKNMLKVEDYKRNCGNTEHPDVKQAMKKHSGSVHQTPSFQPNHQQPKKSWLDMTCENIANELKRQVQKTKNVAALDNSNAKKVTKPNGLRTQNCRATPIANNTQADAEEVFGGHKNPSRKCEPNHATPTVENATNSSSNRKEINVISSFRVFSQPPMVMLEQGNLDASQVFFSAAVETVPTPQSPCESDIVESSEKSLCMFEQSKRENWNTSCKGTDESHSGQTQDSGMDITSTFGDGLLILKKTLPVRDHTRKRKKKRGRKKRTSVECEGGSNAVTPKKRGRKKKEDCLSKAREVGTPSRVEGRYGRPITKPKRYVSYTGKEHLDVYVSSNS